MLDSIHCTQKWVSAIWVCSMANLLDGGVGVEVTETCVVLLTINLLASFSNNIIQCGFWSSSSIGVWDRFCKHLFFGITSVWARPENIFIIFHCGVLWSAECSATSDESMYVWNLVLRYNRCLHIRNNK